MDTAATLNHVSKRFGAVQALDDVSLRVMHGEVMALLGPNGAGKTTAISLMLGLRSPTSGQVRIFDMDPHDRKARTQVGVMLQESGVPGTLRVCETIDLFRSYYPHPLLTATVIERAGLDEKMHARVDTLSGGQRQRLYFAVAICGNPAILFLDEPSVALDVASRQNLWTQIRDFAGAGKTIVLTTHNLEEADALANRIVVIDHGKIIAEGTPAAIKSRVAGKHVRFDTPTPLAEAVFAGLTMQSLDLRENHATVLTSEPEMLLRSLFQRGVEMNNLEVTGAGLEEAFLSLTAKTNGA